MDPTQFKDTTFGTVEREPGKKWAFYYFRPARIPRELEVASLIVV